MKQVVTVCCVILLTGIAAMPVTAQTVHFHPPSSGSINATLLVAASVNPTIDDSLLAIGDEIGVYTPGGILAGAAVWTGSNIAITLWGDDDQTTGTVEGFVAGDSLVFKIWDASAQQETVAAATWTGVKPAWSVNAIITTLAAMRAVSATSIDLSRYDLSGNGEIDIFDVAEIAKYFGQSVR